MNWNTAELNLLATLAPVAFGETEEGTPWVVFEDGRSVSRDDKGFMLGDEDGSLLATTENLPDLFGMTYETAAQ